MPDEELRRSNDCNPHMQIMIIAQYDSVRSLRDAGFKAAKSAVATIRALSVACKNGRNRRPARMDASACMASDFPSVSCRRGPCRLGRAITDRICLTRLVLSFNYLFERNLRRFIADAGPPATAAVAQEATRVGSAWTIRPTVSCRVDK